MATKELKLKVSITKRWWFWPAFWLFIIVNHMIIPFRHQAYFAVFLAEKGYKYKYELTTNG